MIFSSAIADDSKYYYYIDLVNVIDDKVQVQLLTPEIKDQTAIFSLPKIIPGTYKIADYGRFISDFRAFDKKGRELEVMQLDKNSWEIENAKKLYKISYWVDDTYDTEIKEDLIYPMAGTNIDEGNNYVINTPGFFGYFEGMKESEIEVQVLKPKGFYGSTGLINSTDQVEFDLLEKEFSYVPADGSIDIFKTSNYNELMDSPIMYSEPDTTLINVSGSEVLISVYSPADLVSSKYVAENIEELLYAQRDYLGGNLPVEKYAFIFYMEDWNKIGPIQGALEHSYSSFYYFPDVQQEYLKEAIMHTSAHEFFHILTPLTIHSEEIQFFDYNDPKMSEHLWLYEGVTEYFASNVQVKYGLISEEEYLDVLKGKIVASTNNYNDDLSFTDLSKYTLDKYPDQYANVYQKGALIGMCMDLILLQKSEGTYGMQNLMLDLSKKYGKENAFKDEELFDVIEEMTYPEVRSFLDNYVKGGGPLPLSEVFSYAGVEFQKSATRMDYSLGNFGLGVDPETYQLFVANISNMNEFGEQMGYQKGDIILKINNTPLPEPLNELQDFFDKSRENMKEGDIFQMTVLRENENGEQEEIELSSEVFKVEVSRDNSISFKNELSEDEKVIKKAWLEPRNLD